MFQLFKVYHDEPTVQQDMEGTDDLGRVERHGNGPTNWQRGRENNEEPGALVSPNDTGTNWTDDDTISDESFHGLSENVFNKVMFVISECDGLEDSVWMNGVD